MIDTTPQPGRQLMKDGKWLIPEKQRHTLLPPPPDNPPRISAFIGQPNRRKKPAAK